MEHPASVPRLASGLAVAAVLSIAIGVALNATVFSCANKLLFSGLPVADPANAGERVRQ
jgi:hypothetical protein